jgi:predicted NAD/FAD-binding protein
VNNDMRIAIVGTGISGLVAAYLLHTVHDVTVFEANDYVGGHTNTVDVQLDGERHAIDTGFIVFNERNYPNFVTLIDQLGVASQPSSMSFSVRCDRSGLEYNGTSLNRLFAQRSNLFRPRFHRMIRDILRFGREARAVLERDDQSTTVQEFVNEHGFGRPFVEQYLVPMGSSLWSCPPRTFRQFPVRFVVEFFDNHAMLDVGGRPTWRVIRGGSRTYVDAITRGFRDRIRLNSPVETVRRLKDRVELTVRGGAPMPFDHVILACHSDQALAMLADPSDTEREILDAFPYQRNTAVLHTDTGVLPKRKLAWASWNYHIPRDEPDGATITYNMNSLQSLRSKHVFCVTLNETESINSSRILGRFTYEHPIYTAKRAEAQRRHGELINANRTSFCGAYWGYGFHEDGVNSALAVCRAFGRGLAA